MLLGYRIKHSHVSVLSQLWDIYQMLWSRRILPRTKVYLRLFHLLLSLILSSYIHPDEPFCRFFFDKVQRRIAARHLIALPDSGVGLIVLLDQSLDQ
jgi:hypothetical protein